MKLLGSAAAASTDAATKGYVDTAVAGVTAGSGWLVPVQAHTRGIETFTISGGTVTQIAGLTINGYTPVVGDRILIPNAPSATGTGSSYSYSVPRTGNGIYVVTSLSGGNISVSRTADFSGSVNPVGLTVYSEYSTSSWLSQAIWTVVYPTHPGDWVSYGNKSIQFQPTGGLSIGPNFIYIGTGDDWSFAWSNGTGSTRMNPTASAGDQSLTLPTTPSDVLIGTKNLPAVNGNSSLQTQAVTAGTAYYVAGSALTVPSPTITGMVVGTRFVWRVAMMKTAAGTGAFNIIVYRGTNGSTSDTADVTRSVGTQTAAVDNMIVDVEVVVTATGATGSYYWSVVPTNKAVTATGFGVATGTSAYGSGTVSSVALNTSGLKFGLGFSCATGTPTITIPYVQANAYNLV